MSEVRGQQRRFILVWLVPLALLLLAAVVRLAVAAQVPFPTTEVSAYFVGVAQNVVAGEGLLSDSVWSYATPPLEAPKPAFELWLPMASLIAAASMTLLGSTFDAAQVGHAVLGALVAPLVWAIAREAAHAQGLDERRSEAVAIAAGLIAAVLSPFVLSAVTPDSYTPFTIFVLLAALLLPRTLGVQDGLEPDPPSRPRIGAGLGLGIALGLAYLSRQEVIWLGLAVLLMMAWVVRGHRPGSRLREMTARLWPVVVGGLLMVVPWLLRNAATFGSPLPGQAVENMFLRRNEDIFAFLDRPTSEGYLAQGLDTILGNPVNAMVDAFINVLLLPAFPIGIVGLLALLGLWRSPAIRRPTSLAALLLSGLITLVTIVVLFPVASLWGTFAHASGPLLAGLVVVSALGADALLARISRLRRWEKPNVIVGPIALLAVVVMLGLLQLTLISDQSRNAERRYDALASALFVAEAETGSPMPDTIITDHPMWMAEVLSRSAIALPDEATASVSLLGRTFDAPWVVVVEQRGRYPEALLTEDARSCLAREPRPLTGGSEPAWLFILADGCGAA